MNKLGIYLLANYPSESVFLDAVKACDECGVDFLEVGFAFSDPVADGDLLERASVEVLKHYKVDDFIRSFRTAQSLFRGRIYIMTYTNIVYSIGPSDFVRRAGNPDGLILADLPLREMGTFEKALNGSKTALIGFVTPESRPEDLALALKGAKDFIYFVSKRGTTGGGFDLDDEAREKIASIRGKGVDIYVGFGIQNRQDVQRACEVADGAIIGTRAVAELEKGVGAFREYLKGLR